MQLVDINAGLSSMDIDLEVCSWVCCNWYLVNTYRTTENIVLPMHWDNNIYVRYIYFKAVIFGYIIIIAAKRF